jgi:hypothetical protein
MPGPEQRGSGASIVIELDVIDVQNVEIVAGSITYCNSINATKSIGCSRPEHTCLSPATKAHHEEDVRFAGDCDMVLRFESSRDLETGS